MKKKVDFVHVGPHRTASSKIWEILNQTEQVCLSGRVKETDFFLQKEYEKRIEQEFQSCGKRIVGEFGMSYFTSLLVARRIYKHNENCKIIIGIRHPVYKTLSLLQHYHSNGRISGDFEEELIKNPLIIESGRYSYHVNWWIELFGRQNVFLFDYDHFRKTPELIISELFEFLNISIDPKDPSLDLDQKKGSAEVPRIPIINIVAVRIARFLRKIGLNYFVNTIRDFGIKKVLSKKGRITFSDHLIKLLNELYKEDVEFINTRLKASLSFKKEQDESV